MNVQLFNGKPLIAERRVTGFSNAEEEAVALAKVVSFALETALGDHAGCLSERKLRDVLEREQRESGGGPAPGSPAPP